MARLIDLPQYVRFWSASTVSSLGDSISVLALQVLAAVTLNATATEVGWLTGMRWVPYLLVGLLAGAIVDRYRRKPVLVGTDVGRAVLLCAVPLLYFSGHLNMISLLAVLFVFGVMSVLFEAASQAILPSFVPRELLTAGNARLEQASSVAHTAGPVLAGALVKAVSAPVAIVFDAFSFLISGLLVASVRIVEPARKAQRHHLIAEIRDGLRWVYGHSRLASMAWTSHVRFLFMSMLSTVYVVYTLRDLNLGAFGLGITYAFAGIGAVVGGSLASILGRQLGTGRTLILTRGSVPVLWAALPLITPGAYSLWAVCAIQFGTWVAIGVESPNDIGYRQSITPDHLLGRMNATIRSLNWGTAAIGAPIGGALADHFGYRPTLWFGVCGLGFAAVALSLSPFRHARLEEGVTTSQA